MNNPRGKNDNGGIALLILLLLALLILGSIFKDEVHQTVNLILKEPSASQPKSSSQNAKGKAVDVAMADNEQQNNERNNTPPIKGIDSSTNAMAREQSYQDLTRQFSNFKWLFIGLTIFLLIIIAALLYEVIRQSKVIKRQGSDLKLANNDPLWERDPRPRQDDFAWPSQQRTAKLSDSQFETQSKSAPHTYLHYSQHENESKNEVVSRREEKPDVVAPLPYLNTMSPRVGGLAQLIDDYRKATRSREAQSTFLQKYQTTRFYVENSMARRANPDTPAKFVTHESGTYMAITIFDAGQEKYYVFPRFGFPYEESAHGPGAMGKVFYAQNYSSENTYDDIEVIQPAEFFRSENIWRLKSQGIIKLS